MTKITFINPWSKAVVHREAAEFVSNFDGFAQLIDENTIEAVNDEVSSDDKAEWLATWAKLVGPEETGRVLCS